MNAAEDADKRERFSKNGESHPNKGGGARKQHTRGLTARLANCADEGETD